MGSAPRCWDSAFDNILRGIPETEESDFFDPGANCVADTSRITIREFVPQQPSRLKEFRKKTCILKLFIFLSFLLSFLPSFLPSFLSSFLPFFLSSFLPFYLSFFLSFFLSSFFQAFISGLFFIFVSFHLYQFPSFLHPSFFISFTLPTSHCPHLSHFPPVITDMDDAAADRYEKMMAGERPEADALMDEDFPLPQDLDVPDPAGRADAAAFDPPLQGEDIAARNLFDTAKAAAATTPLAGNVASAGPLQGEDIAPGNLFDAAAATASTSLAENLADASPMEVEADPLYGEDIFAGNLFDTAAAIASTSLARNVADAGPFQGEDIVAGNLFDTAAATASKSLTENLADASLRSGISLLRDGTSHPAMHSTRVEHSDLQLSSANQDAASQANIPEIPAEQLMRGIIPEIDYSQDFFDPSSIGDNNAAAAPQADISLPHRSIPGEEALPSTSVSGAADEAHLSVNNLRRSERKSSSQQSIRIVAGEPTHLPQNAPIEDPPIGVDSAEGRGLDLPQPPVEEAAPMPPAGAVDPEPPAPRDAREKIADAPAAPAPPAPPPRRVPPRRPKPFRDVEIAINREIVKRRIRKEQENEGLEDIPTSLTNHLMIRPKPDMEVILSNPGWLKDVGSKIKPFYQENLVTKQRGNAEGTEDEDEDEIEGGALDRELTREGDRPSMASRGNSTLFNRTGLDPSLSGVEHSRRGERSLSQSQQALLRPSFGETSGTRQPAMSDEQIPVANLPAVQEEMVVADTAGVKGPPARDDVESVDTVLTTDTAPSTTSSVVPTVTVTEPSPPDDIPPGTVPGCVKFPDKPKEKSTSAEKDKEKLVPLDEEELVQNVASSEPMAVPRTPRGNEALPAVLDILMTEDIPEQDRPEILSHPVPGASIFDENPPEPHEFVQPAPPSPVAVPVEDAVADFPSDVAVNPSFRRLPAFQELCPPTRCSRKRAIDVFNGVLRASLKQLVHAIQDGRTFGGEIELFCRGVDSQHGADCFCRDRTGDLEFVYRQFLSCLEPIVSAPTI